MTNKRLSIVVTGGLGFIGSNLIPKLIARGHRVTVIDDLSSGQRDNLAIDNIQVEIGDIRDDMLTDRLLGGADAVIHLAARGSVVESISDPGTNFSVNVEGTFALLEQCKRKRVGKLVFASTGGALFGNTPPPVSESTMPAPISPYGASKLCGEAYCRTFSSSFGMEIVALRFANVIGPVSAHKKGAVTRFIRCLQDDRPMTIYGDGSSTRDFLDVDDLCDGIMSATHQSFREFEVFHLSSGVQTSILDLATRLSVIAGKPGHPIEFEDHRIGEVAQNFAENDRARETLQFNPGIDLDQSLRRTWDWFCSVEPS